MNVIETLLKVLSVPPQIEFTDAVTGTNAPEEEQVEGASSYQAEIDRLSALAIT